MEEQPQTLLYERLSHKAKHQALTDQPLETLAHLCFLLEALWRITPWLLSTAIQKEHTIC